MAVKPIPEGFHALTPHLVVRNAVEAIAFYEKAFGAREVSRSLAPGGRSLLHAQLQIGDSIFMLAEENPDWHCRSPLLLGGTPVTLHLFVEDVDAVFAAAVHAGAEVQMPLMDAFWGDRFGQLKDPFGHEWSLATHKEDLDDAEIERRSREAMARMDPGLV